MSRAITVTLSVDEALFTLAALDTASATAHAAATKMRNLGDPEDKYELAVAHTTATTSDAARKRIADVLYPMATLRRADLEDEVEFGLT